MMLWCRCGDSDGYNGFDALGELAEYLISCEVSGPLERCGRLAVECDGHRGRNYISLYWGIDEQKPSHDINNEELAELNRLLMEVQP